MLGNVPDLIWTIGVILSGIIVASAPLFVLRRRDSWRPLTVPVTMLVGLAVFVVAPFFLGDLGRWLGAAVLGPAKQYNRSQEALQRKVWRYGEEWQTMRPC